ncbi:Lrp/AsnC ligand binding domain-containing protein [Mesorhizobium sp. M0118]|uniref:Lrp/AsnC ligand binding domain-containing protein n=1 Tax=Mesorhizobium sp. M0118 TaxID=2956884 RepID=UPI00333B0E62
MQAATEVTECYLTTGSADFVVVLAVDDVEAFKTFVKTKLNTDSNVRKFKSMIALTVSKSSRGPRYSFRRTALTF